MLKPLLKNPLFKFFASLKLAVLSILSLAGVLAAATIYESLYGARGAHVLVYGTWWFAGVLFVLGLNVLCAALSRFPWKRSQTGFVVTHLGILILLFGSYLTQRYGVDGNLPVVEGQQDGEVILNELMLKVADENGKGAQVFPVPEYATRRQGRLMEIDVPGGKRFVVDDFLPRAVFERRVQKSPVPGVGVPAIHVELFNSRFRLEEWLQAKHPDQATELNLGPAVLGFKKLWSKAQEDEFLHPTAAPKAKAGKLGLVVAMVHGKEFRVDIEDGLKGWRRIGATPIELKIERYLPYAIVEKNELVNKSNDPVNPAVQLFLRDASGNEEKHTLFANFPEFATLHKSHSRAGQKPLDVKLQMMGPKRAGAPEMPGMMGGGRGQLLFAQSADDKRLLYLAKGKSGEVKASGEAKPGEAIPTGWMDLQFKVQEWLEAAVEEEAPRYIEYIQGGDNYLTGVRVRLEDQRVVDASSPGLSRAVAADQEALLPGTWLMEGVSKPFAVGEKEYFVQFGKSKLSLPFQLRLEKFTMGTDPGTTKAASYESRVVVKDEANGVERKALISMNEPLHYGGYTFYQASYQMEEGRPPLSVFSVNYDPGRVVKYAGSLVMVLGIIVMFWLNPHYFGKIVGRGRKEEVAV